MKTHTHTHTHTHKVKIKNTEKIDPVANLQ